MHQRALFMFAKLIHRKECETQTSYSPNIPYYPFAFARSCLFYCYAYLVRGAGKPFLQIQSAHDSGFSLRRNLLISDCILRILLLHKLYFFADRHHLFFYERKLTLRNFAAILNSFSWTLNSRFFSESNLLNSFTFTLNFFPEPS